MTESFSTPRHNTDHKHALFIHLAFIGTMGENLAWE
jgi:hypothetical protein